MVMTQSFLPGDDLIFQLESGFGLLRVIAIDEGEGKPVWHLMAYEELFPDIESAETALGDPASLHVRRRWLMKNYFLILSRQRLHSGIRRRCMSDGRTWL
ncbi:MAG: hypothetical protein DMF73_00790 [Acidobacteria bacterium]|nr:MAG: hypothetical protein DMF73_00790 [Acidobacteriota bacterium]